MRIAYVCYWDVARNDGVAQKIETQLKLWQRFGHQAELFAVAPGRRTPDAPGGAVQRGGLGRSVARIRANSRLADAVGEYRPDLVYLRYDLFTPAIARLLRRLPSVIEINSDDRAELRRRPAAGVYNEWNRRLLLGASSGFVCVTHELAQPFRALGKPVAVIANGIDLADIAPPPPDATPRSRPALVWIGGPDMPWNGLDKLVWLADHMSECDFSLVGVTEQDLPRPLPENLRAYGHLARSEYHTVLRDADVALGTLALHRKGMQEASPLKVREYLAYGLPVVAAYSDTDFLAERPWYLLGLPNTESNVRDHVAEIRAFVSSVRGRRIPREDVADRIGAAGKERKRLAFFEQVRQAARQE